MNNIVIQDLKLYYRTPNGNVEILKDICMSIPLGGICGLIGRTGAGKTTLIKAIVNMLPDNAVLKSREICFPESGEEKISVVLQNPFASLNPTLKIKMQFILTFGILKYYKNKKVADNKFKELLQLVELPPTVMDKYPAQLSGGMCQRINIALSLLNEPMMLILDEPTSALDAELRRGIMNMIARLCKKRDIAALVISHDMELVKAFSDVIYILKDGATELYKGYEMDIHLAKHSDFHCQENEILLHFNHVSKSFHKTTVLDNVSFTLKKRECLGIVGHSGCGKSTIAKILCGIYKQDYGEIVMVDGCSVEMLFQDAASSLNPTMNVKEALNESRKITKKESVGEQELTEWFAFFGLPCSILKSKCCQLSGGQRQMIALMRIMLNSPDIIILDEPTSSMDVFMQKQTLDFLNDLKEKSGVSYILISHDESVVSYMCDSVLKLST